MASSSSSEMAIPKYHVRCELNHLHRIKDQNQPTDPIDFQFRPDIVEIDVTLDLFDRKIWMPIIQKAVVCPIYWQIRNYMENITSSEVFVELLTNTIFDEVALFIAETTTWMFAGHLLTSTSTKYADITKISLIKDHPENQTVVISGIEKFMREKIEEMPFLDLAENFREIVKKKVNFSENIEYISDNESKNETQKQVDDSAVKFSNLKIEIQSGADKKVTEPAVIVEKSITENKVVPVSSPKNYPPPGATDVQWPIRKIYQIENIPICNIGTYMPKKLEYIPYVPIYIFRSEREKRVIVDNLWADLNRGMYADKKIYVPMFSEYSRRQSYEHPRIRTEMFSCIHHFNEICKSLEGEKKKDSVIVPIWSFSKTSFAFDYIVNITIAIDGEPMNALYDARVPYSIISRFTLDMVKRRNEFIEETESHHRIIYVPWKTQYRLECNQEVRLPLQLTPFIQELQNELHYSDFLISESSSLRRDDEEMPMMILGKNFIRDHVLDVNKRDVLIQVRGTKTINKWRVIRGKEQFAHIRQIGTLNTLYTMSHEQLQQEFKSVENFMKKKAVKNDDTAGKK